MTFLLVSLVIVDGNYGFAWLVRANEVSYPYEYCELRAKREVCQS